MSAGHPAGAGDWPDQGGIAELDELDSEGDREDHEDEGEEEGGQNGDEDKKNGK